MMRIFRWLLLVAIAVVAVGVVRIYRAQRTFQRSHQRAVPPSVALDTKSAATDWEWGQSGNGQPQVKLFAKDFKQSADSERAELKDLELQIYQKDGLHYDRVKSAAAQFTTSDNKLYSPGEAQITLDVPVQGDPPHQLTSITTSGINFDSKSGLAVTDQHVSFTFENGDGFCTGASYDPQSHTMNLNGGVTVNLRGKEANSKQMKVESQQLAWNETTGVLLLFPWSRLTSDQTVVDAATSTVVMKDGKVSWIDAPHGHGMDKQPNRQIEYAADLIHVHYDDDGAVDNLTGMGNAKLVAHGTGSETTMTGDKLFLTFVTENNENILTSATATGKGYLESKPLLDPAGNTPDTKIIKADILELHMKPSGKDIDLVEVQTPGTLDFLPNQIARHRRLLKAERMTVAYGARNEVQSFHATAASTETYPSEEERQKKRADLAIGYTNSKTIDASFDEHSQLKLMKQTGNFRYTEGVRKAQSDVATFDNDRNVMNLETNARISDDTGSTSAERIQINQATGDFEATGHTLTTRLPEQQKSASAMLDKDEPTQGTADKVISFNHNHLIHYTGNAVVWQSANRIQADTVDIDRDKKTIVADGKVVTEVEDKMQPVFTVVKAQHMVYTDQDRLAIYSGGVDFRRPMLTVKSAGLKAWLNEQDSDADSRINRAFGDGKVEIVQVVPDRTRIGTGEHAEYYTVGGKIVLSGGSGAQLNDTKRGNAKGTKLTYYTDDDRLDVDGVPEQQAKSHLPQEILMQTLETVEISKSYRGRRVVNDVSVKVSRGEIVGLLGPNGAGKTTSFYIVVGLISPDSGKVLMDGADLTDMPMFRRAQRGISYLPQEASVFRKLSVADNLMAILQTRSMSARERRDKMNQLIGQMGLETVRHSKGYQLSGGERRRVEIARSLAIDPSFLLLDEPFSGIDPIQVIELQQIVLDLKRDGLGILVTDHNVRETLSVTDRAYIINAGKIFRDGSPDELAQDPEVKRVYLGESFSFNLP